MDCWQLYVRHAHRDVENRRTDNHLSPKGRRQCEGLIAHLDRRHPDKIPLRVLSSPKKRCLETAEFIAKWAGVAVEADLRLDEQFENERDFDFLNRVQSFFYEFEPTSGLCIVSHGDVLPLFARLVGSSIAEVSKGDIFWIENKILRGLNEVATSIE